MSFKEKITEKAGLPKDIVLNYPKITLLGDNQLEIENHKGIIEYSQRLIRINTFLYCLKIQGDDLTIASVTNEYVLIKGKIKSFDMI